MLQLEIGYHMRMRAWLNTKPPYEYTPISVLDFSMPISNRTDKPSSSATIELLFAVGPFSPYGLLGCTFEANQSGVLSVQIGVSQNEGAFVTDTLPNGRDNEQIGLPFEYAQSVYESAKSSPYLIIPPGIWTLE